MRSLTLCSLSALLLGLMACSSTPPPEPGDPSGVESETIDDPDSSTLHQQPCGTDRWDSSPPSIISDDSDDDA